MQKRLFVYQLEDRDPVAIVNPTIAESRGEWEYEEGCLSIPGLYFPDRPAQGDPPDRVGTSTATRSRSRPTSWRPAASSTSSTTSTAACCITMLDKDQRKEAMRELRRRAEAVGS